MTLARSARACVGCALNPDFYHDYRNVIEEEEWTLRDGSSHFRIHAVDLDGEVVLGAHARSAAEAYWRLCGFIDDELVRRRSAGVVVG